MKLMRLGERGQERPCVLDADGTARDVSGLVSDFGPDSFAGLEARLAGAELSTLPAVETDGVRVGAPIARPRNVWCIGMNHSDHAAELGAPIPPEPILVTKPGSAVCGPNDPVPLPDGATKLDWEVELGVVIGDPHSA